LESGNRVTEPKAKGAEKIIGVDLVPERLDMAGLFGISTLDAGESSTMFLRESGR
jgi:Zn-dependent alcohol dehydrogenase